MSTKHKHADLIHAWADGAFIEVKDGDRWLGVGAQPYWYEDFEYRIKPEEKKPVVRWQWITIMNGSLPQLSSHFYTEAETKTAFRPGALILGKAAWTRTEFEE